MKGSVCLVGAGCGSADFITLRGQKELLKADVVVYDDLLDEDLLPAKAEKVYVGKRQGKHSAAQEEINRTLVALANEGKRVCRLKGGDSFVFGRGGEEIAALNEAGIPWEIVPGISSCIAVPEMAGIPVTYRGLSRSFHVITAHTAKEDDSIPQRMEQFAKLEGTLVFLMGLSRVKAISDGLIEAGKPPETAAAVIGDCVVRGTLADIAEKAVNVKPPAVILVGDTAGLKLIKNTPLEGLTVGITGTGTLRQKLEFPLKQAGAAIRCLQKGIERTACEPSELAEKLHQLEAASERWLAFTSPRAVDAFFELLTRLRFDVRRLSRVHFAVIGPGAEKHLEKRGIYPELISEQCDSASLSALLSEKCSSGSGVLLLHGDFVNPDIIEILKENALDFEALTLYKFASVETCREKTDYVILASVSGVREFFQRGGAVPRRAAVCIGMQTAACASEYCDRVIEVKSDSAAELIEAIVRDVEKNHE